MIMHYLVLVFFAIRVNCCVIALTTRPVLEGGAVFIPAISVQSLHNLDATQQPIQPDPLVDYRLLCNGSQMQPDDYVLSRPVFIGRSATDSRQNNAFPCQYQILKEHTQDFKQSRSHGCYAHLIIDISQNVISPPTPSPDRGPLSRIVGYCRLRVGRYRTEVSKL